MNDALMEQVLGHLEKLTGPDRKGWLTALCPYHDDQHPSLKMNQRGFRCMACGEKGSLDKLAAKLGLSAPEATPPGLTVAALAKAKGLPEAFLRSLGVADGFAGSGPGRIPCVGIPYANERGEVVAVRKRLSLDGSPRFIWRRGDHPTLYGLAFIEQVRLVGWVVLVEGESDTWTLWQHRVPALGVPGATGWQEQYAPLLQGLTVYVWQEPDLGGDTLVKTVAVDLPEVRIIEAPPGSKDPSDLYLQDPHQFRDRLEELLQAARPASALRDEALSREAREAHTAARHLLEAPDVLERLVGALQASGYVGDPRPALLAYVAITSRLLQEPLNVTYVAQSAAGKNAAVDAVLPFFPPNAYYLVRASSPRALVYTDQVFTHRTVILWEADSLPEEGAAASAVRSLMSDREMTYEVVEQGLDGRFATRRIVKPGPTGLVTTSVKPLGEQASTRMLTVAISDSPEQTRRILHAQADRRNEALPLPEHGPWVALQRWLELAGERRTVVPFAHALADAVPARAVRVRRDFAQLLTVVQALALLSQRQRGRDPEERVVATLEDYAQARWLLEEVFATAVSEGVTPAVRETVGVVGRLSGTGGPVTEQALAQELGLAKSSVQYRVRRALQGGWLVNQATQRGAPTQLVLGTPLPGGNPLPEVAGLAVCAGDTGNDSNRRTPSSCSATSQIRVGGSNAVRTGFEPDSNRDPAIWGVSEAGGAVRRFEPKPVLPAHTEQAEAQGLGAPPWESFLEEVGGDDATYR
ncbi:MAG: hypothetical protein HY683_05950 [Chloroflexi bacterium]|nr:hypothetical protein [Chloroflexota bacterium]